MTIINTQRIEQEYSIKCDGCVTNFGTGQYTAGGLRYSSSGIAEEVALKAGWHIFPHIHLCPECVSKERKKP